MINRKKHTAMDKDMRSCLGKLLAAVGIIAAYFIFGFTLRAHDFFSGTRTRKIDKECQEVSCSMARLTADGLPRDRKKNQEGIASFSFLRCAPLLYEYTDGRQTCYLGWAIDCATDARFYRGGANRLIDHYPQKIHLRAGSRVGVVLTDGTEIIATLQDTAIYTGTQRAGRGTGHYVQRFECLTDYSGEDYLLIRDRGVRMVWFEAEEGRLECPVGRLGRLELMHKMKKLTDAQYGKRLIEILRPQVDDV